MLNDRKERYIETSIKSETTKKKVVTAFENAKTIEEKYNKDLSEFRLSEIKELDKKYNSIYSGYYNWCVSEAYVQQNINLFDMLK